MELYSIASGSSGNSIFAGTSAENTGILLDAGISKKRIEEGLAQRQLSLDQVEAIFITHEHADHISDAGRRKETGRGYRYGRIYGLYDLPSAGLRRHAFGGKSRYQYAASRQLSIFAENAHIGQKRTSFQRCLRKAFETADGA